MFPNWPQLCTVLQHVCAYYAPFMCLLLLSSRAGPMKSHPYVRRSTTAKFWRSSWEERSSLDCSWYRRHVGFHDALQLKGRARTTLQRYQLTHATAGVWKEHQWLFRLGKVRGVKDGLQCIAGKFNRDIVIDATDCIAEIRTYCDAGYTNELDGIVRFGDATSECIRQALFKPTAACHQATLKKHLDCDPTYVAYPNNTQTTLP